MVRILNWNGKDIPGELADLPASRYIIESVEAMELSSEEEAIIEKAIDETDAGTSSSLDEVDASLRVIISAAETK